MDVCVVTYRNDASRIQPALRSHDHLWVRDNTDDNVGFAVAANELARRGVDPIILFINPDGDPQPGCFDAIERCVLEGGVVACEGDDGHHSAQSAYRSTWLSGSLLAVRREAFELIGGFDESFFLYGEDVDLSWRLAPLGRLVHCDDAVFLHDGGGHSLRAQRWHTIGHLILNRRYLGHEGPGGVAKSALASIVRGDLKGGVARLAAVAAFVRR